MVGARVIGDREKPAARVIAFGARVIVRKARVIAPFWELMDIRVESTKRLPIGLSTDLWSVFHVRPVSSSSIVESPMYNLYIRACEVRCTFE